MRGAVNELLLVLVLAVLLEMIFIALGGAQWLQQRLGQDEPREWLWRTLSLFPVWGLLLGWYAFRCSRKQQQAHRELQGFRESEQRFTEVANALAEGLLLIDSDGCLLYMNPEAERLLGWPPKELAHRNIHQLIHRHEQEPIPPEKCGIYQALIKGRTQRVEEDAFIRKDGSRLWVAYSAAPMLREGRVVGVVTVFEDIGERKRLREELEHMATHDRLTGLANRGELEQRLQSEFQRAKRYRHPVAVLMVDIDHFKEINDTLGHHAGDEMLQAFAERLSEHARRADTVARYGGEEFVLVLPETSVPAAVAVAERLRGSLNEVPVVVAGAVEPVTASIGVAGYPNHGVTGEEVLRAADKAMYAAKNSGRNCVVTATAGYAQPPSG